MVFTVNLNPNIDRTIELEGFVLGGLNRVKNTRDDAASKGINVSRALKAFGIDSICTGFMYEQNGRELAESLEKEAIRHDFIWQPGCMRMNIKLIANGQLTEINDRGVPARTEYLINLKERIKGYAGDNHIFIFNGSLPPGCPADYFAELIVLAQRSGSRCILDADGDVLTNGIEQKPYCVKINKHELESYSGCVLDNEDIILRESLKIIKKGVRFILVSLGAEGAIFMDGINVYRAYGININVVSPTGAGDSMVAAIVKGLIFNKRPEEILHCAVAAATATSMCEGTGIMTMELYDCFYDQVKIEKTLL